MQCAKAVSGMCSWSVGRVPHLLEGGTAATVGSSWRLSSWSLCCSGLGVVVDWLDACSLVLGSVLPCVVEVRCCTTLAVGVLYSLRMVWCRCTISTSYLIQYVSLLEKILIIIFVSIYCIKGCLLLIIILVDKPAGQNDLYLCKFTY
jgi:hypothetical protein